MVRLLGPERLCSMCLDLTQNMPVHLAHLMLGDNKDRIPGLLVPRRVLPPNRTSHAGRRRLGMGLEGMYVLPVRLDLRNLVGKYKGLHCCSGKCCWYEQCSFDSVPSSEIGWRVILIVCSKFGGVKFLYLW
jgi:hypothetical protein